MTSGKIFLNNTPPLPGKCAACNNDFKAADAAIDFGASLDYYGAILLCKFCIVNAAELVNLVPVAKLVQSSADLMTAQAVISTLQQKVRALESLVSAYLGNPEFSIDSLLDDLSALSLFDEATEGTRSPNQSGEGNQSESSESVAG